MTDYPLFSSAPGHVRDARARWQAVLHRNPDLAPVGVDRWLAASLLDATDPPPTTDPELERELERELSRIGL